MSNFSHIKTIRKNYDYSLIGSQVFLEGIGNCTVYGIEIAGNNEYSVAEDISPEKSDVLKLLPSGTYKLAVIFTDGTVEKNITIDSAEKQKAIFGDVNFDGNVDSADALAILRASIDYETFDEVQTYLADVDADGDISSADAVAVLRYSVDYVDYPIIGQEVTM